MTTIVAVIALLLAMLAIAYAWKMQQEMTRLTRRLDRYNRSLFDANDEIRHLREELAENTAQLRVELMRQTGAVHVTPEMTVRQVQMLHPQAGQVLAGFHLGGCSSCAVEPDDTLTKLSADHNVDLDQLLSSLNLLFPAGQVHNGSGAQLVRLPNVALEF
jgi:hypothetical protein